MAFIIAEITEQQKDVIVQRGIPHREIPQALVDAFRGILPAQMTAVDALERLIKEAILDVEGRKRDSLENQLARDRVSEFIQARRAELGL